MTRAMLLLALVILLVASGVSQAQSGPQWINVKGPQEAKLRALVFHPPGEGPFPVVVVLHGSPYGLRDEVVDWGPDLTRAGFVTVVGCYFKGTNTLRVDESGTWMAQRTPGVGKDLNPCPEAPKIEDAHPVQNVIALMDAGRRVPGARSDRVGLLGWSDGGGVATVVASSGANVQAVVAVSGGFDRTDLKNFPLPISLVQSLGAPLLILHGTKDDTVPVEAAREYEKRATALGKNIQAYYFEGGSHRMFIIPQYRVENLLPRVLEFLNRYLRP